MQDGKYRITAPNGAKLAVTFTFGNLTLEQTYQSNTGSDIWAQLVAGKTYYLMVSAADLESREYYLGVEKLSTVRKGDINGDGAVDAADAGLISRCDAGFITLTDEQLLAGDVNGDGEVDAADAGLISRYDAGFIASLDA